MKSLLVIAAFFLLFPIISCSQDSTNVDSVIVDTVVVTKVSSGTTFTTDDGRTITLLGLSTPKSQAVSATDAREYLASLIEGRTVVLTTDSLAPADTKKTKLRYVHRGTTLINETMLQDGYAAPSSTKHSLADSFRQAHSEAKSSSRGAYATERSTSVQCSATTQKGTRCKRMTKELNGKCWQHQ